MVSLYFAKYTLELIDAYANEVTKRVLQVFDHIEQEADGAADECWQDTGNDAAARTRVLCV
jgi:hypothetical protein